MDIAKTKGVHDSLVLYEKEPFKMMVLTELKKAETLKPIDNEVSMITNLQNLKQGLKSDFSDRDILNTILLNLSFTDQLIDEHLGLVTRTGKQKIVEPKHVGRDPSVYRNFVESTYHSKDREDPYTHFFLKEGAMREALKSEVAEE